MKKIFLLTAYEIKGGYFIEKSHFTSKGKATDSAKYLIEYLIKNHSLKSVTPQKIELENGTFTFLIDGYFNVTIAEFDIKTKVLKYI